MSGRIHKLLLSFPSYSEANLSLRLYPLNAAVSELHYWRAHVLRDILTIKNSDLKAVHF